ncbi:MAG: phosphatidate cytidylyltransferase, partial [Clostridiales bacterium]|nr:phosphatidate cytidylyltransferase [Candidatus Apopatousia equi]
MKTRVITGSIIGLIVAGFFALRFVSPYFFDVMLAVIMVCGAGEVSKVFNRSGKFNNMTLLTLFPVAVFVAIVLGAYFGLSFLMTVLIELTLFLVFTIVCFIWTTLDKTSIAKEKQEGMTNSQFAFKKTGLTMLLYLYPTVVLSALFYINHMIDFKLTVSEPVLVPFFVLVMLFITTMLTDVMAYSVGSLIKGPKLCPYISPNKTISGAIGGVVGAVVGAILTYFIFMNIEGFSALFQSTGLSIWVVLAYSIFASAFSQAGDIFASWLKRTARTKDFSAIFPGHGGFMDRCDGLAFNAVFT